MKIAVGVNGACGRMGRQIVALAHQDDEVELAAALDSQQNPDFGRDAGEIAGVGSIGVHVTDDVPVDQRLDVVIDFSLPAGTMSALELCLARKAPLLIATTGHTKEQLEEIEGAAHHIAVLKAPNTSLAVNLLFRLVGEAAKRLAGKDFDVEILERHHRFKKDSPSGTALRFAHIVKEAMGQEELRHGREGDVGARPHGEIGVHAVRVGDNVGEHTIVFSTLGETIELTHRAHSRDCYARGALQAAKYLANRPARRYTMDDVLGFAD